MKVQTPTPGRPFAVLYFGDSRRTKPSTQGYTKNPENAKVAAVRHIVRGFVTRVEIRNRETNVLLFSVSKQELNAAFRRD